MLEKLTWFEPECVAPVGAILGEGPLWDPRDGLLYCLDIKGEKIFSFDPQTENVNTYIVPGMVSALGLATSGGFMCSYRDGFAKLNITDGQGTLDPLVDPEKDKPANRFNDGKIDPAGGFWSGTMDDGERDTTGGTWWRLGIDGKAIKVEEGYHVTNGPAFDPDRHRVFLTDSARQTVYVANTDGKTISNKQVFLTFGEGDGYPDGMEIDRDGCLWIAFWDGSVVRRFSPEGALLAEIKMPVPRPTSLAIVGDTMFVTSASVGLSAEEKKNAPLSGGLFKIKLSRSLGVAPRYFDDAALA